MVRCFENEKILHVVEEDLDASRDASIINAELAFADLVMVERRIQRVEKVSEYVALKCQFQPGFKLLLYFQQRVLAQTPSYFFLQ